MRGWCRWSFFHLENSFFRSFIFPLCFFGAFKYWFYSFVRGNFESSNVPISIYFIPLYIHLILDFSLKGQWWRVFSLLVVSVAYFSHVLLFPSLRCCLLFLNLLLVDALGHYSNSMGIPWGHRCMSHFILLFLLCNYG